ncbi:hypothetical protein DUNSADRAFT_13596 [Dunaliella salina]|uniref:Encoded protein n=1 Tax=Dunaliella salina TaxID=3046 RepID=A0ABQ7G983_DUNSA|nr:hypothetical protein DUNSADRAFT_13596 [Dunaliella salina]|eukprot:KAF5831109.1 hypothetical protein DUNSADRAFT_13596 [Dunaliella salina]
MTMVAAAAAPWRALKTVSTEVATAAHAAAALNLTGASYPLSRRMWRRRGHASPAQPATVVDLRWWPTLLQQKGQSSCSARGRGWSWRNGGRRGRTTSISIRRWWQSAEGI